MMRGDHLPGLSGPRHVHTRVPSDFLWMRVRVCAQVLRDRRGPGARFAEHEGLGGAGPGLGKRFGAALRRRRIWDLWPTLRATLVLRQYIDRRRRAVLLPCAAATRAHAVTSGSEPHRYETRGLGVRACVRACVTYHL